VLVVSAFVVLLTRKVKAAGGAGAH
jgi:hypothetical protein